MLGVVLHLGKGQHDPESYFFSQPVARPAGAGHHGWLERNSLPPSLCVYIEGHLAGKEKVKQSRPDPSTTTDTRPYQY